MFRKLPCQYDYVRYKCTLPASAVALYIIVQCFRCYLFHVMMKKYCTRISLIGQIISLYWIVILIYSKSKELISCRELFLETFFLLRKCKRLMFLNTQHFNSQIVFYHIKYSHLTRNNLHRICNKFTSVDILMYMYLDNFAV